MKKMILSNLAMVLLTLSAVQAGTVTDICQKIATYDANGAAQCVQKIGNNTFDQNATQVCANLANTDEAAALACISVISNGAFDASAVAVCTKVATYDAAGSVTCLKDIINKAYANQTVSVCQNLANTDEASALQCLINAGTPLPTKPACPNAATSVDSLKSALQSLDQYNITVARQQLVQLLSQMESCQ
jgi:hypothetical protein